MGKFKNIVTPDDVETQQFTWGTFQWMNAPEVTGTSNMTMGFGTIYPGEGHARHNHPGREEFIYFMGGTAEQTIETPDGTIKKTLHPGDMIFVPPGAYHSTYNTGEENLTIIACYQFAGPEAELRDAAEKVIPAKNGK